jgi:hypothetical protein
VLPGSVDLDIADTAADPFGTTEVSTERAIANLGGATVLSITTGADAETAGSLLLRGPAAVRSRLRAVAASDYATSALDTPDADVARAHCLPSRDLRGSAPSVPGTVTVVVVPRSSDPKTPPTPAPESLAAVARHLASVVGVVGVRVVTAAPAYRAVSVSALLIGTPDSDPAVVESVTRDRIDTWLSPIRGYDGTGWPFGGTLRWDALVRDLLAHVPKLTAVSRMTFRVDGRRLPVCTDVPLAPDQLFWPGGHVLQAVREGGAS